MLDTRLPNERPLKAHVRPRLERGSLGADEHILLESRQGATGVNPPLSPPKTCLEIELHLRLDAHGGARAALAASASLEVPHGGAAPARQVELISRQSFPSTGHGVLNATSVGQDQQLLLVAPSALLVGAE